MQTLDSSVAAAQLADRQAAAAAFRAARHAAPVATPSRRASASSCAAPPRAGRRARSRASRSSTARRARPAPMLVAELDGEIVAAVPFDGGRAIADPFRPTAELVELLRARTRLLAGAAPAGRLQRLRPHLRPRIAA